MLRHAFTMTVICDANKTGLELSFNIPPSTLAQSDDSYRVAHGAAPGPTYVDTVATLNPLNEKPSLAELRRPRQQTGIQEILVHCRGRKDFLFKRSSKSVVLSSTCVFSASAPRWCGRPTFQRVSLPPLRAPGQRL